MKNISLCKDELNQLQNLGSGACSTVYKFNDDLAIKILNDTGVELHDEERFSKLLGIENETFIFPQCRVEIDGQFQGYAMQYVNASRLLDIIKKIDLQLLIEALHEAENGLKLLARDKISIIDLNQGGIMWSKEGKIKVIDTDFYQKAEERTEEEIYNSNFISFESMIEEELGIQLGQNNTINDFLQFNIEYSKLYMDYLNASLTGDYISVTELLNKAIEIFNNKLEVDAKSIEEMEKIIKENNLVIQYEEEQENETPKATEIPKVETFEIPDDKLKMLNDFIQKNLQNRKNSTNYDLLYRISEMMIKDFKIKDRHFDSIIKPSTMEETKEIALQFFKQLDQELYEKVKGVIEGKSRFSFNMYMLNENEDFSLTDNDEMPIHTKTPMVLEINGKAGVYVPCKGNAEDVYVLVHELSHTFDFVLGPSNPTRNMLGEVTPHCFEAMLSQYLLEKGIVTKEDVLNREKETTISHYDDGVETFAKFQLMKLKEQNGDISQEDIIQMQKKYGVTNKQLGYVLGRMAGSEPIIDYRARYMTAQLIYPHFMEQYEHDPQNAIKTLKEFFGQIKSNKFIGSLQTLGIEPREDSIQDLIKTANTRFNNLEKTKQFSIQEMGKATINTPTQTKDKAREQVAKDEQQIEQGELKK